MVTINQMAEMIMQIAGKKLSIQHIPGPTGVRGRNSDNRLFAKSSDGSRAEPLRRLVEDPWIASQAKALAGQAKAEVEA